LLLLLAVIFAPATAAFAGVEDEEAVFGWSGEGREEGRE